jgi:flagellar L-ring protein FlgH
MTKIRISFLLSTILLSGCSSQINDLLEPPALSPVGSGLKDEASAQAVAAYPVAEQQNASWIGGPSDLFRDRRAHNVGDILTVEIAINDKAALSNNSNLSRKSNSAGDLGLKYSTLGVVGPDLKGSGSLNSSSSSAGQGTTIRSENIELSVAAVVTAILPNGYLLIRGSQEIQVNYETRLLKISGVVHPADIADNGKLSYDKIAEARISYGGKGTISEVQKPGWGQRLLNRFTPF